MVTGAQTAIVELAKSLAQTRRDAAHAEALYKACYEAFLADNALIVNARDLWREYLAKAETALREAAVAAYNASGEKHLAPGVEVKVGSSMAYDPAAALAWAKAHTVALSLDKKAFESIAPSSCPELVQVSEKPTANIATDLDKFYAEATPTEGPA